MKRSKTDPIRACFIGRCEPRKGLHIALRAWHDSGAANEGTFVICGQFVPRYEEILRPLLDHRSVKQLGFIENPETVLFKSDVLILPSLEEGSALVTYEARAAGCLLLVSNATGAYCKNNQHGFVHDAGDAEQLTSQLAYLDRNREEIARLCVGAISEIDEYSWSAVAARIEKIYRDKVKKQIQ
jgi:glycosyltransferase involved in cell wall biosynthesis